MSLTNTSAVRELALDSVDAVRDCIQSANGPLRIVGAGSWLKAGRPVLANQLLTTANLRGIIEYVPGDLTMTVRAGTSLAEIESITQQEGQWLGIDPAGTNNGTIGATVATASSGPLSHGIGRMRDIVLGVEFVTGNGAVVRSGGKVVKNVAGFDITRLQVGAWGTLGVITEISLRLRALPEVDETLAIALDPRKPLSAHLVYLRDVPLATLATELVSAALARQLGVADQQALLVRLGGNDTRVNAQRKSLAVLGSLKTVDASVWTAIREIERPSAAIARVSHLPSQLSNSWSHAQSEITSAMSSACFLRATISRGLIRAVVPFSDQGALENSRALASIATSIASPGGHVVWERLPDDVWNVVPSAVNDALASGLQRAFDSSHRLNPGIMGHRNA